MCNLWHFKFLCTKENSTDPSVSKENKVPQISSGTVWTNQTIQTGLGVNSILPTFSVELPSGKLMRYLKDSGCQLNFIESKIAKREGLEKVKTNCAITVN